ncbi:hypothetical protein J6590_036797 [Homalodisca vitripennis]|nr:hypothetical protein J6590_036797 [Homalodisca vitripennis]
MSLAFLWTRIPITSLAKYSSDKRKSSRDLTTGYSIGGVADLQNLPACPETWNHFGSVTLDAQLQAKPRSRTLHLNERISGVAKGGRRGRAAPGVTFFGVTPTRSANFKNNHHPSPPQAPQQQAPNPRPEACMVLNTSDIIGETVPKATGLKVLSTLESVRLLNDHVTHLDITEVKVS